MSGAGSAADRLHGAQESGRRYETIRLSHRRDDRSCARLGFGSNASPAVFPARREVRSAGAHRARPCGGVCSSMCAHKMPEPRSSAAPVAAALSWLGGGHRSQLDRGRDQSTPALAGGVVVLGGLVAWLVAALAVGESARWPLPVVAASTLLFGALAAAATRATVSGQPDHGRGIAGRAAVAVLVGVVVAELAALV